MGGMRIQQLRHVVAAGDQVSYAKAAKVCFTSRQNIAHSVRCVEEELNVLLFERKDSGNVLTPAGCQVVESARTIVKGIDEMKVMFVKDNPDDSVINLAVSTNLFAGIPSATSAYFLDSSSCFHFLELDCEECCRAVCSDRVDAAIIMSMKRGFSGCSAVRIADSPAFVLVENSSVLSSKSTVEPIDLKGTRLSVMSKPPFQYVPLFIQLDSLGYDYSGVSIISSTSTMLDMVRKYGFVGIVSEEFALNPPKGTVAIPFADRSLDWIFYFIYKHNAKGSKFALKLAREIGKTFEESTTVAS